MKCIRLFFAILFLCTCICASGIYAATITAASPSRSDVQSAVDQAADGDTVQIPAGTSSWSSNVNLIQKINNSNIFGLEDKIYNFFPENLEIPEQFLERIVTRYFDFEKIISDENNYSIKKEFKKILEFQDSLVNIVIENKEKSENR